MKTIILEMEIEYDESLLPPGELIEEYLTADCLAEPLLLHSNTLGDTIGRIINVFPPKYYGEESKAPKDMTSEELIQWYKDRL